ncbi:MAG: hypothetical protein OJF50_000924 [Nitrospira sp.]|nr:hypothetical protein [Nitrospira sp.]
MARSAVHKSFKLDSEPVLIWPKISAKLKQLNGFALKYSGSGREYSLYPSKGSSVTLVGWDPKQKLAGWRNVFAETELQPTGLRNLSELGEISSDREVCDWVSKHGLLGFCPSSNPITKDGYYIPTFVYGKLIHHYEPVGCIRLAANRAKNVLRLWSALKNSFTQLLGGAGVQAIQSVLTIKQDEADSHQLGTDPIHYRVFVNGESRSRQPVPDSPRDWRYLANVLLAEYVHEHILDNIRVSLRIREENKCEDDRAVEPSLDWNLMPIWEIETALTAYYVELLMVMRRFRACKTCGSDISHQRARSYYCGNRSTCRSKDWHRQQSTKRKATKASIG